MTDIPRLLIVDDELSMRELLEVMLERDGYQVATADNGEMAMHAIDTHPVDLILCDIRLGDMTGIDVLQHAKKVQPDVVVIMISAYASTETAVDAMNHGAYDYVPKPFDNDELMATIAKALSLRTLEQEKKVLDDDLKKKVHFGKIIGDSPAMMQIYRLIDQVAKTRSNILVTGESGTGKELIARAVHEQSTRASAPFVAINCGGIPDTLMESELFGHKKGSFTGATADKKGLFESADTGTVFLDEVSELNFPLQVKLLRAVQERRVKPVGGNEDIPVDVRFISATNKNLEAEVISGQFREDLFYRLNVIELKVPPLRSRKSDIRILAQHFLDKYSREMGKEIAKLSSYALDMLQRYGFPGNVRELENLIERSVALSSTNIILPDSLTLAAHKRRWIEGVPNRRFDLNDVANGVSLEQILADIEKAYLEKALALTDGNKKRAADLLGLKYRSFWHRVEKMESDR